MAGCLIQLLPFVVYIMHVFMTLQQNDRFTPITPSGTVLHLQSSTEVAIIESSAFVFA